MGVDLLRKFTTSYAGFTYFRLNATRETNIARVGTIEEKRPDASFGISIGEKAEWSKGYGTDALRAICDFGFGQLRLERIELDVYEPNLRAQRSYQKAGFVKEGVLRRAHFSDGRFHDVLRMSLLREEWEGQPRPRPWDEPAPADGA